MTKQWRLAGWLAVAIVAVAQTNPLPALRKAAFAKDVATAEQLLAEYRAQKPEPPQLLEAISWVGRAAHFAGDWEKAEKYGREAYQGSVALLKERKLDAEPSLPLALGAAIEVLGAARDGQGDRGGAVTFLRAEHAKYIGTSIETRIQKNLNLLTLEGQPAPPIAMPRWIGERPRSLAELKGNVVLAFFWAHWCGDCKRQMPALVKLHETYGKRGLTIIGPTRLYGYISRGLDASPDEEMTYLQTEYQRTNRIPVWMKTPVSSENFRRFGVSTTPTLLLVDRQGIVRLYHPGTLEYEELAAKIEPLLQSGT
jgi:thiol-disulfide isomerase/thioredoxin